VRRFSKLFQRRRAVILFGDKLWEHWAHHYLNVTEFLIKFGRDHAGSAC
jgi:hypothetical protein